MIQRFEDEYPDTKIPPLPTATSRPEGSDLTSLGHGMADASLLSTSAGSSTLAQVASSEDYNNAEEAHQEPHSVKMNRSGSNTSLAAKAQTEEEGRMHRFGQGMRREVLRPTGMTDYAHGTFIDDDPEPEHLAALRKTLEGLGGMEIKDRVEREGGEKVIRELGVSARELKLLEAEDPDGFERFKGAQFAMALNGGMGWDEAKQYVGMTEEGRKNGV